MSGYVDERERSLSFLSPKVKLEVTADRGRILVASSAMRAGEVVVSEEAYAFVVTSAYRQVARVYI